MVVQSWAELDVHRAPAPRVSREGERIVVWLSGDQDVGTVPILAEALAKAIADDEVDLVVDLSQVSFIDAATFHMLLRGQAYLQQRSRDLTLRALSPRAQRIVDLCELVSLTDVPSFVRAPGLFDHMKGAPSPAPRVRVAALVAPPTPVAAALVGTGQLTGLVS